MVWGRNVPNSGHTSMFVTFSGTHFLFNLLEFDLSVNLSVPSM